MHDDKKWEEDDYARTVTQAAAIQKDPKKRKMAKSGAKRIAKEKMIEAKAMQKLANSGPKKPAPKKAVRKPAKKK